VIRLVGTVGRETKVVGLLGRHGGELDVKLGAVRTGNLLVHVLGEHADCVSAV
jgi:hypothetical protein